MSQKLLPSQYKHTSISNLPEKMKRYTLELTNGSRYLVSGEIRQNILRSKTNFVELPEGSTINKSFIIEFKLNPEETRDYVREEYGENE